MWLLPPPQAPNKGGGGFAKDAAGGSQTLDLPGCRDYLASSRGMVTTTVSNSNNNCGGWESQVRGKVRARNPEETHDFQQSVGILLFSHEN